MVAPVEDAAVAMRNRYGNQGAKQMQVALNDGAFDKAPVDLLVFGVFAEQLDGKALKTIDGLLGGALKESVKEQDFSGRIDERLVLHTLGKASAKRVAVVGLGPAKGLSPSGLVHFGGNARRVGDEHGAKSIAVVLPKAACEEFSEWVELLSRGAILGGYRYDTYRSEPNRKSSVTKLVIYTEGRRGSATELRSQAKVAAAVAKGVSLARDLVNEPPIDLYPESFAKRAEALAKDGDLKIKVLKPTDLKRLKMGLLLGVGAGSAKTPRLVHLSYVPAKPTRGARPIVFVGKGITFDSGGLDLKPAPSMLDMKMDMGGAAAVMGAMQVVAEIKPKVPVHGILALAENMPSGTAIRPGDVLKAASGRTVEINNTDAEGRLVLGDALHYATALKPGHIVDLATLTGACIVALGPHTVGVFSNDDAFATEIVQSAERTGEDFWRLPLNEQLRDQLRSDVADTKNTGERWGGAITAALFLSDFVGDHTWAHLDIAGPAMTSKEGGALSKGGTGVAVSTLIELVRSRG